MRQPPYCRITELNGTRLSPTAPLKPGLWSRPTGRSLQEACAETDAFTASLASGFHSSCLHARDTLASAIHRLSCDHHS